MNTEHQDPTPDPTRHEASRPAFEKLFDGMSTRDLELRRHEIHDGVYYWESAQSEWEAWQAALDHAAAQVCGWTHDATNEEYDTDCAHSFRCVVYGWDCVPGYCAGCGRRVKILDSDETTP